MKKTETKKTEEVKEETKILTEKEEFEVVCKFMKDRGINSISDIENKIARL